MMAVSTKNLAASLELLRGGGDINHVAGAAGTSAKSLLLSSPLLPSIVLSLIAQGEVSVTNRLLQSLDTDIEAPSCLRSLEELCDEVRPCFVLSQPDY